MANGKVELAGGAYPVVGSPEATHILVLLFDHTCNACRNLHRLLKQAIERYPRDIAVMFVPVPGDSECNPRISRTDPEHAHACGYARLGLSVWIADWEKYAAFSEFMLASAEAPRLRNAIRHAEELVGGSLDTLIASEQVDELLVAGIDLLEPQSNKPTPTPTLLLPRATLTGHVPTFASLDEVLRRQLGLSSPALAIAG